MPAESQPGKGEHQTLHPLSHVLTQRFKELGIGQAGSLRGDGSTITAFDVVVGYKNRTGAEAGSGKTDTQALAELLAAYDVPVTAGVNIGAQWGECYGSDTQIEEISAAMPFQLTRRQAPEIKVLGKRPDPLANHDLKIRRRDRDTSDQ